MIPGIIGKKIGMTRIITEEGVMIPVTLIQAGPCTITQVKSQDNDGYTAVQLGFQEEASKNRVTKPLQGHFKKAGSSMFRILREFHTAADAEHKAGDVLNVNDVFAENEKIKVRGISKGAGFAGGMKRHGFKGSPASHGAEKVHRRPMSAGATDAARVFKGKRSPGQMGSEQVTIRNLTVIKIDAERNLLAVRGAVPGKPNGTLILEKLS